MRTFDCAQCSARTDGKDLDPGQCPTMSGPSIHPRPGGFQGIAA